MTTKASHRRMWKRNESDTAEYIGGERIPVSGRARGDAPDIRHAWLSPEAKLRASVPGWIKEGMDQAQKSSRGSQLPVVIIREKGQKIEDSLICMTLKDFKERWL